MDGVLMLWRARLRQHVSSLLFLTVLVAVGGGAALACIAGARRTTSSFDRIAEAVEFPDVVSGHTEEPARAVELAEGLDGVQSFSTQVGFRGFVEGVDPSLIKYFIGAWDELRHQRPVLQEGRLPQPAAADEVLVIGRGAEVAGVRPGDEITITLFTSDFTGQLTETFTVVGTGADASEMVSDAGQDRSAIYFTPAFTREHAAELQAWSATRLAVEPGAEELVAEQFRALDWPTDETITIVRARVQDAVGPLVITLVVLGVVVLLATLVVAGHALARQADLRRADVRTARALGFTRQQGRTVELLTVIAVAVPSALLAVAVAIAVSPWFPLGGVRALEPARGVDVDVVVLALGALLILAVLVAVERLAGRQGDDPEHRAAGVSDALLGPLPPAVGTGLRLAVGGTARERRRFWTTIVTSSVALAIVLGAISFVGSLTSLIDEPQRYGVGWDLTARNAYGSVDGEQVASALADDPNVVSAAGASLHKVTVDDELVPGLAVRPIIGELWPTVIEGRTPRSDDEVLAGTAVLSRLDAQIGDTVTVRSERSEGAGTEATVEIVGTAVFPAVDIAGIDPTRLDDGLAMTWERYTGLVGEGYDPAPDLTFFDLADGADPGAVISRFPDGLPELGPPIPTEWLSSLTPAEVVESDAARGLIWTVIALLGIIVVATIGHGMATTVRRHRGDYAVLKTIGFTRRQVLTAVTAQSTATIAVALLIGVPLGVVLGRWSWRLFARDMGVIESPVVPVVPVVVAAAVAVLAALVITIGPARRVGRASPALTLRAE